MQRRSFLGAIAGVLAGAALDPERLLWVPGKKVISIPAPREIVGFTVRHIRSYDATTGQMVECIDVTCGLTWKDPEGMSVDYFRKATAPSLNEAFAVLGFDPKNNRLDLLRRHLPPNSTQLHRVHLRS